MALIDRTFVDPPSRDKGPSGQFKLVYLFAAVGAVFLLFEIWTITAWLVDDGWPHQVTQYRNSHEVSWWAARVYESLAGVVGVSVLVYLVRSCVRARRLTFDAQFCIATALLYFGDPYANWAQPLFYYSSNWVNVANWCGHDPFVVNPDCGRLPEPILFVGTIYVFGLLAFAMAITKLVHWIDGRWGPLSKPQAMAAIFGACAVIDLSLETPIIFMHLWGYPGFPISFTGEGNRIFPLTEVLAFSTCVSIVVAIRYFKDDRGLTIWERGLERHRPAARSAITVLATFSLMMFGWFFANGLTIIMGPYIKPYATYPASFIAGQCDAPGITGTVYGTCPGTPGYKAPIRTFAPSPPSQPRG
jgi:hypothetical protein